MKTAILWCLLGTATADLRRASQAKKGFKLLQQNGGRAAKNFVVGTGVTDDGLVDTATKGRVLYMEPSTFGYKGLVNQRKKNYDNFLRSNIDNEQDNRNFNNEAGLDHLPFRSFESVADTKYPHDGNTKYPHQYTAANEATFDDSLQVNNLDVDTVLKVKPGEARVTPLRWNNPHAAEIEVNLWIMCADPPTVIPVKKPTCSGEGNQNNIIEWAIPSDFNDMDWQSCEATKCFNGCVAAGDCVLQIYAHSVETRQYTTSVPIIVTKGAKGDGLDYSVNPKDIAEATAFAWPTNYDLKSLTQATPPSSAAIGGVGDDLSNVKVCVSSQREGISPAGDAVDQVELTNTGTAATLNAPKVNLYLCKRNENERAAEKRVKKVVYSVTGANAKTKSKRENYTPFEMSSVNKFNGDADLKTVVAELTSYSGTTRTITVKLDMSINKRWRFRRHLQAVCPTGKLKEPTPDPWYDLSKLKRETCLSAQDPNANYKNTLPQRGILHSDVANHAYQNSNYSPYSGQQHSEISRTMQAAAVIHMTSANRGELGKNNIPNAIKQTAKQLNKQVNKLYKAYEKVANKVIDTLTAKGDTNGGNIQMGVQPLGTSFRAEEKGATSTKRLKTTTYVPSFNTKGYDMATIQAVIAKSAGNNGEYADLLSTPKPTGDRFIEIYTATMNKMLPAFAQAQKKGVTYMESVKMVPCSTLSSDMEIKSKDWTSTSCCTGSLQNRAKGGCGATLADKKEFQKRNADGKTDGGQYAAQQFNEQRFYALYQCPAQCLNNNKVTPALVAAVTKTSKGTCVTYVDGADGCVATKTPNAGIIDCRSCSGIFNNVAPKSFGSEFSIGKVSQNSKLDELVKSVQTGSAEEEEESGNVLKSAGDALVDDDTAICHTPSSFECPNGDADFAAESQAGKCTEQESAKIDRMCDDGPCDSDSDSELCVNAKRMCEVDPDSGVLCMPNSENDPCQGCVVKGVNHGEIAAVSAAALVVLALTM